MSLVAAVAVAGLTTVNAGDLSEAIKNTTIGGYAAYRYDDRTLEDTIGGNVTNDRTGNTYKTAVAIKSKVNDTITYKAVVASSSGYVNTNGASTAANLILARSNFIYSGIKNTAIIVGKQSINSVFTVASSDYIGTHRGDGISVNGKYGPIALSAAYFNQTGNLSTPITDNGLAADGGEDILLLTFAGNFGPATVDASFIDRDDTYNAFSFGVAAKIAFDGGSVSPFIRYTDLDSDANGAGDNVLAYLGVNAKFGKFGAGISYGFTDKEGGTTAEHNDAKSGFQGWGLNLNGEADSDLLKVNVNFDATEKLNVALNYNILDIGDENTRVGTDNVAGSDAGEKWTEAYVQATYKPSKNLMAYVRLGQVDYDQTASGNGEKGTRGRLHINYSF